MDIWWVWAPYLSDRFMKCWTRKILTSKLWTKVWEAQAILDRALAQGTSYMYGKCEQNSGKSFCFEFRSDFSAILEEEGGIQSLREGTYPLWGSEYLLPLPKLLKNHSETQNKMISHYFVRTFHTYNLYPVQGRGLELPELLKLLSTVLRSIFSWFSIS